MKDLELSEEQIETRRAMMSEEAWPVISSAKRTLFLGWDIYDWCDAPKELIEHFKLTDHVRRWRHDFAVGHVGAQSILNQQPASDKYH